MELIAGTDEVGRGPLAGPVVAAAVILDPKNPIEGLKDSKQLTEKQRDALAVEVKEKALAWAIGRAEVIEIDSINIFQASLLAMKRAVEQLSLKPTLVLVDGKHPPIISCPTKCVIGGDALIPAISAASIIAKVYRDAEMTTLCAVYPQYKFSQHKGYSTKLHLSALKEYGPCEIHRRSFAPVKDLIASDLI